MSPPFDWWPPDGPWPVTPGGIRGPDGRHLTHLYDALVGGVTPPVSLLAMLESISLKLTRTNQLLQHLVGDPDNPPIGWSGLPNYLGAIVASADERPPANLLALLASLDSTALNTLTQLGTNDANRASDHALLMALLTEANFTWEGIAQSGSNVSAVLGDYFEAPANTSIKALLADSLAEQTRAADCCEESNQEPSPVNDPPEEDLCEGIGGPQLVRAVGLVPVQQGNPGSAPGETRIGIDFGPGDGGFLTYDGVASAEAGLPVYVTSEFGDVPVCVQWNLLGDNAPPWQVERVLIEQVGGAWEPTIAVNLGTAFATPTGSGSNIVAADRRIAFRLSYVGSETSPAPGLNFWLSYGEVG